MNTQQQVYYSALHRKAFKNRKTVADALTWLETNYTGDTRKARAYQMGAESWQTTVALQLRLIYKNLIRNQKDTN